LKPVPASRYVPEWVKEAKQGHVRGPNPLDPDEVRAFEIAIARIDRAQKLLQRNTIARTLQNKSFAGLQENRAENRKDTDVAKSKEQDEAVLRSHTDQFTAYERRIEEFYDYIRSLDEVPDRFLKVLEERIRHTKEAGDRMQELQNNARSKSLEKGYEVLGHRYDVSLRELVFVRHKWTETDSIPDFQEHEAALHRRVEECAAHEDRVEQFLASQDASPDRYMGQLEELISQTKATSDLLQELQNTTAEYNEEEYEDMGQRYDLLLRKLKCRSHHKKELAKRRSEGLIKRAQQLYIDQLYMACLKACRDVFLPGSFASVETVASANLLIAKLPCYNQAVHHATEALRLFRMIADKQGKDVEETVQWRILEAEEVLKDATAKNKNEKDTATTKGPSIIRSITTTRTDQTTRSGTVTTNGTNKTDQTGKSNQGTQSTPSSASTAPTAEPGESKPCMDNSIITRTRLRNIPIREAEHAAMRAAYTANIVEFRRIRHIFFHDQTAAEPLLETMLQTPDLHWRLQAACCILLALIKTRTDRIQQARRVYFIYLTYQYVKGSDEKAVFEREQARIYLKKVRRDVEAVELWKAQRESKDANMGVVAKVVTTIAETLGLKRKRAEYDGEDWMKRNLKGQKIGDEGEGSEDDE
jgi:hypothetical protein